MRFPLGAIPQQRGRPREPQPPACQRPFLRLFTIIAFSLRGAGGLYDLMSQAAQGQAVHIFIGGDLKNINEVENMPWV